MWDIINFSKTKKKHIYFIKAKTLFYSDILPIVEADYGDETMEESFLQKGL